MAKRKNGKNGKNKGAAEAAAQAAPQGEAGVDFFRCYCCGVVIQAGAEIVLKEKQHKADHIFCENCAALPQVKASFGK